MVDCWGPHEASLYALGQKLKSLGVDSAAALAFSRLIRVEIVREGEDIIRPDRAPKDICVLLSGIGGLHRRLENGSRQIYTFYYPGDFCALHGNSLQEAQSKPTVAALTVCTIGVIDYQSMDQALAQHPKLGLALWRAAMLEASIIHERSVHTSARSALQRVAHLLCEQLARCHAAGINNTNGLLRQRDLADATGLSMPQINRTLRDLRQLRIISCNDGTIEVLDKGELGHLACFDDHYLSLSHILSHWKLCMERDTKRL
jgi:CRP-like cAMP-binding protein